MARLPSVSGDNNTWGTVLNTFLQVGHNANGTLIGSLNVYDVTDDAYGAKGDGTTNDATAIQAAITAAQNAGGGVVYFPKGTYKITTGLTITASNVSLIGAGAGASIIQTPSGSETVAMLIVGNGTTTCGDVVIADLQFLGVTQKTANAAIKLQKCFRTHIERIRTQGQYRGVHVFNSTATWIDDTDIRDSSENGLVYESTLGNGFDCYLTNVLADNPVASNTGSGLLWFGGENLVVQNCDFIHFQTGCLIAPPTGQQCRFGFFVNAEFDTSSDNTMKIAPTGGDVVGLTFTNGWSGTATNYGVLIDASGGAGLLQGVRFVGHKSFHNGLAGFRITGGAKDIHLTGCDVISNSQTTANSRSGIEIASSAGSDITIEACNCKNGYQQGSTQNWGINFDTATYTNVVLLGNDVTGNTAGGINLNTSTFSGGRIQGNLGHNPIGHSVTQPAVPASTTVYTNTSGYDCMVIVSGGTVSAIAIGGTSTGLTSGVLRVPAGQTITLTYTVAPTWTWFGD